ncbi:hypothetical protein EJ05DRAFT_479148 [Pseudovirgaria hyperparasitica]|uniref:N-acetyltransferase domain-containing protein n=1 Tax=Pseudovirgaria hyperparasitica TaxID=470096 RepID=A0A6A6VYH8_9PEZI|nr:uncharacterized protein EJ05DRAFT_479148 [Pseudovirgaria hyperparasitica]KAF2754720.1 hypothetical protein EJ05DRAFT_479148 [Pseudovirgaria hyperparasitica]
MAILPDEDGDKPEGCVIPFTYPNSTGWLGFFIMNAAQRGHGVGRALFAAAQDYFAKAGTQYIGLDGVEAQVETYGRRGFVTTDRIAWMVRSNTKDVPLPQGQLSESERLVPLEEVDRALLVQSDLEHTGFERRRLWSDEGMFSREDVSGFAVVDSKSPDRPVKGWILVRSCEKGFRFGPIYANTRETASLLVYTATESLEAREGSLVAEVWRSNKEAMSVMEHFGWTWYMDFHRMWVDARVPEAQRKGGKAETGMFAIFDASEG